MFILQRVALFAEATIRRIHHRAGFTLLEVMVAMSILVIALTGALGLLLQNMVVTEAHRRQVAAIKAAEQRIEQLRDTQTTNLHEIYNLYNNDPADDPGGPGTGPGPNFDVPGLLLQSGDTDGFCGRVYFPTTTVGANEELREDSSVTELGGGTIDFDGLNGIDSNDHSLNDNLTLLPVCVIVEWQMGNKPLSVRYSTVLVEEGP